jgi:hypothetical protein
MRIKQTARDIDMSVILFEGDYVLARGAESYSEVIAILNGDYVLLESGQHVLADESEVVDYRSAAEYAQMKSGEYV